MMMRAKTNWKKVRLGDVATLHRGYDLPIGKMETGNYPVVFSNGKIEYHNAYKIVGPGVVTGRSGTLGNIFYMPKDFWPHNTTLYVSDFHGNESKFIYYLLKRLYFARLNGGSGVPTLNRNHVYEILVTIPESAKEQKRIADILSAFDDKIELNDKISRTLETMAQAIFKEWFIKKLDDMPDGWQMKKLSDIAGVSIGRTPPREQSQWFRKGKDTKKWISIKDMGSSDIYIFDTAENITEEAIKKFNIQVINPNTVVLSFKLTLGRIAITTEEMLSNEAIAHVNLDPESNNIFPEYLYLALKNFKFSNLSSTSSIGIAVNSKMVRNIEIPIPDKNSLEKFKKIAVPIFEKLKKISIENQKLTALRDLFLPKLMNGEIKI